MESAPSSQLAPGPPRMQYRSRPVSVAVDPVSLVIAECICITSEIRKRIPSTASSVSAILGGNPNTSYIGAAYSASVPRGKAAGESGHRDAGSATDAVNRWGLKGSRGRSIESHPFIASFGKLRHELSGTQDIHTFDAPALLQPFLEILQTKGTAAPITILALDALRKFLAYGFICPASPRFAIAMQSLSTALTHCQFSDSGQMELVLLRILNLMEDMLSGPGGDILNDESVCDMMGRGLAICSQPGFSPVLRQTAEASVVRMCQIIFEDVKHFDIEVDEEASALHRLNGEMDTVISQPTSRSADTSSAPSPEPVAEESSPDLDGQAESHRRSSDATSHSGSGSDASRHSDESEVSEAVDIRPYSLASIRELFRVLISFLDPNDKQHSDKMRIMALRIIHVALEVAGPSLIQYPSLALLAEDKLCCFLFQLVRSDNLDLLQESLVVASTLLATCRGVLKLQQELFLSYLVACLHPAVEIPREPGIDPSLYAGIPQAPQLVKPPPSKSGNGRATPVQVKDRQKLGLEGGSRKPDARQAMVECISVLSRMPAYMVELFVNYDSDEDRVDLCEDMVGLLSRNALPDSATWSTTSVPPLCLDALLKYVQFIAERLDRDEPAQAGLPDSAVLRERRRRKKVIITGATKFNDNPKAALGYLESQSIIESARDPVSVARFLKGTSRVSKKILGEFLSKMGNELILDAFIDLFDFSGKRVDEALRLLLESFRLPGESPLIERIVSCFSEKYCAIPAQQEVADKDAVFILTYAIIMLNTDQHNPNLKSEKRMTFEDFSRNLRGQNEGKDFSRDYLKDIFDSIKMNEIILPDEHDNQHAFDYAWRELLAKADTAGHLVTCNTRIYDADMFASTWRPIVATLSYVFMSATDDAVFARVVAGFDECARIAARYGVVEAFDQIVYCLSQMTGLATDSLSDTSLNTEVQAGDNSVMVSQVAVKLGRNFRSQLATLVLFRVVSGNEHIINRSWKYVIRIWLNLFVNSLIPPFFSPYQDRLKIPAIPLQNPSQVIDRGVKANDTGFFSAFTSYISSYAADDPPEPSTEELESTLCSVDCINQCQMGDIFARIGDLSSSKLAKLVNALLEELPQEHASSIITVKTGNPSSAPSLPTQAQMRPIYDPGQVYLLEFCTVLTIKDEEATSALGKGVSEALFAILRDPAAHHHILVSRAAFYLLQLLSASHDHDFVNVPILLHALSTLPENTLVHAAPTILQGLNLCVQELGSLRSEIMTSPDFWGLLRTVALREDCSQIAFDILEQCASGEPPAIVADNYGAAISVLSSFASALRVVLPQTALNAKKKPKSAATSKNESITRGVKAVNMIYNMTSRIPYLMENSHLEESEAWAAYWLPIFKALTVQCTNPSRDVRNVALTSLQRTLLAPELTCTDHTEWTAIFTQVLFPLIQDLLKPEIFLYDRDGMGEMRVHVASLLCKVFLQYLVLLSTWDGMLDLWLKIVDILDRLMNSGQGDSLEEAVRENLKNVVLFMASSNHLVPPAVDPSKEKIWNETWKRIDRFVPELKGELALDERFQEEDPRKETPMANE